MWFKTYLKTACHALASQAAAGSGQVICVFLPLTKTVKRLLLSKLQITRLTVYCRLRLSVAFMHIQKRAN